MIKFNIDQVELIGTVFKVKDKGVKIEVTDEIARTEHLKIIQILDRRKEKGEKFKYNAKREVFTHKMFQLICPYVVGNCEYKNNVVLGIKGKEYNTKAYVVDYVNTLIRFPSMEGLFWMFPDALLREDFFSILLTCYIIGDKDVKYNNISYNQIKRHFVKLDFDTALDFSVTLEDIFSEFLIKAPLNCGFYFNKNLDFRLEENMKHYMGNLRKVLPVLKKVSQAVYDRVLRLKEEFLIFRTHYKF